MSAPGFTPIQLYYSTTASAAPSSGNLANGELAINITDGKLYYKDNGGTVRVLAGTGGTGVVAGSNTQVQFNNNGVFGASSGLTFDGTTLTANALTVSNAVTLSGGTANGVAYLNGSKVLTTGSALTFDGTSLQAAAARGTYSLKIYNSSDGSVAGNFGALTGNVFAIDATGPANTMTFLTGGSEQMRLTSTGLGIGTSSPQAKLELGGTNPNMYFGPVATGSGAYLSYNTAGNYFAINAVTQGVGYRNIALANDGGNVGIGTSSPGTKLDVSGNLRFSAANPVIELNNGGPQIYSTSANTLQFATGGGIGSPTERMRIDSSGNLLVGTTSDYDASLVVIDSTSNTLNRSKLAVLGYGASRGYGIQFRPSTDTGATPCRFLNAAGTDVGSIGTTNTATSYATSSDYRLKHDIRPMTGALAKVAALKPCTYKWKADGSEGQGFIAHELQDVVPQCVTGEKDAVDADGKPVYQGIDTSFLVATLTAAIQELKASLDEVKLEFDAYKAAHP